MRRYLLDEQTKAKDTEYGVRASKPKQTMARYFPEKDTLLKMNLWKTLTHEFDSPKWKTVPYIQILGRSTLHMLKGLLEEISEEQWQKLNADPAACQVIQNSLFRMANHLASAHLHIDTFEKFSQDIELVHAEMAAILEFASPFKPEDFPEIYRHSIQGSIPRELIPYVQIGLGKSAVNTFAGINAAIFAKNPHPVCAHSPAFYYEQADLMGLEKRVEAIVDNPAVKKIDLYCSQFHANVQPQKGYTRYQTQDIAADIRHLLLKKPETDHLTVAIDYTIDLVTSKKLYELLDTFKDEMKSGRLNFILFKSGQKTDMFGQDNYFGAPFYIINNGKEYWEHFNTLLTKPVHRTDSLSTQWFCLSNKYAADAMEAYRQVIFNNSRAIIDQMPESLRPHPKDPEQRVYVCSVDAGTEISFIDVKVQGPDHRAKCYAMMKRLMRECEKKGVKAHIKQSWGFCHINAVGPFDEPNVSTIRINPSINPEENAVLVEFLKGLAD